MLKRILSLLILCLFFNELRAQSPDPWIVKADHIDPSNYYGVTVANGMIGIVSSSEPFKVKNVVLAGVYDLYGRGRVSNFINSFNLLNMYMEIDGKRLGSTDISHFTQELNMKEASLTTSFEYLDKATISYTCYSLRQLPFTVLMDIHIKAHKAISLTAASVMESPDDLKDVENYYNEIDRPHVGLKLLTSTAKSPTGKLLLCASTTFIFSEEQSKEPRVIHEMWDNNMHLMKFTKALSSGDNYNYSVAGASISSAHHPDPLNEAERMTIFARLEGNKRLIEFHKKAWEEIWKSDILVEGDPQVQQDIHNMLYHLYSFTREGSAYSSSPMGLSGLGYNGHIFWDADLWMFPALLLLHPEMARSMVDYRFDRLEIAKKNAQSHGYKGAMYPWESAESGVEETPVWALSGPFEHHITADVGLAAWNYYSVSQDKDWLLKRGWPILSATADFWASRVERNGPGKYEIKNVVAADEWAENINNDAFTNAAAKKNLEYAQKAAQILGYPTKPDWDLVEKNIPLDQLPNGVTREFDSYKGEGIKQADVNLLAYPLKTITDPVQIQKDLEYYETRVPNEGTPAMTQAIFALLYSRLGEGEKAEHFFKDAYIPNLNPPFRVIAETKGGTNPYFETGAGGVIQSLLMGFGGLEINTSGIQQVSSKLPPHWKSLTLKGIGPEKKTYIVHN
jgi:trehalose/maltose hydrolase-like predicted phosphorylase